MTLCPARWFACGCALTGMAGHALDVAGYYLHWGVIQISLTNFLIIVAMIVVFVAALLIPFPRPKGSNTEKETPGDERR